MCFGLATNKVHIGFICTKDIRQALENIVSVRLHFRLAYDEKQVSLKNFVKINEKIESISKQLSAWETYTTNNNNQNKVKNEKNTLNNDGTLFAR
ncbi:hypothetical protein FACS1894178_7580 [Bacteroidia bacterium]|nr:hypothetical protein FACS1894178_7580 [Bacteroidia bacterium]